MIYALAVSKYFDLKMLKIGSVEINEETTTIIRCGQKTDYINKTISFRYNNLRFKGSHNYIPFLTLGSFTTHTGLNTISLDNGHETISLDIIIKNELELNRLKQLATRFYK